jgi:hypothetical protein
MNNLSKFKVLISILFIAFFLNGCLGTDEEQNTVSLRVIDSSYSGVAKELTLDTEDYSAVNVSIIRIELTGDDTVIVLIDYETDPLLINLLDLGSAGTLLVDAAEIPLGTYNKIRMILDAPEEQNQAPVNPASLLTVEGDVTEYPIFIPSGSQTGLKINLNPHIELVDGSSFEIVFDFNSENTIKKTGQNDRYIIRPTSMSATVTEQ